MRRVVATATGPALVLLGAFALWGWPGAVAGAAGAAGIAVAAPRRRVAMERERLATQAIEAIVVMAAALRAGRSLPQAIVTAYEEALPPARAVLAAAVRSLGAGRPVDDAIEAMVRGLPGDAPGLLRLALRVGRRSGADLALLLDRAASALRERRRLTEERRAATAQARLSAAVIGALPIAALAIQRDGLRSLAASRTGALLAGAGLALEGAGALWVRRLMRS